MRKPGKIVLIGLAAAACLFLAGFVVLKLYFTKERVLAWVIPPLEAKLHRSVQIADAGAGLSGIWLEGLDVRAAGSPTPLVRAQRVGVLWNLWALLQGRIEIREVRLVGPEIRVVRFPDGSLDIQDLIEGREPSPGRRAAPQPEKEGAGAGLEVAVALLSIDGGRIRFEDRTRTPVRTYELDDVRTRVRDFSPRGPVPFEAGARALGAARIDAKGSFDPATGTLAAEVRIDAPDLPALAAALDEGTPLASGRLELTGSVARGRDGRLSARGTVRLEGLAWAGGEAGPASGELAFEVRANPEASTVDLPEVKAAVAGQTLSLSGRVQYGGRPVRIRFEARSPSLDLDRLLALLPPPVDSADKTATSVSAGAPAPRDAGPLPVDAEGTVRIDSLSARGLVLAPVDARVELRHGRLRVGPLSAGFYEGTVEADVSVRPGEPGPPFGGLVSLSDVRAEQVMAALAGSSAGILSGRLELEAAVSGQGPDLQTLETDVSLQVQDGRLVNHPLVVRFARLFRVDELETLNFYSLELDAGTRQGQARVRTFALAGPEIQVTGTGSVGLDGRTLDARLAVAVPRRLASRLVRNARILDAVTDAQGWVKLPLRLRGSVKDPRYALDSEALARMAAGVLGRGVQDIMEEGFPAKMKGAGSVEEELKKGLRRLLGQ